MQVAPQAQASPQRQPALRSVFAFWQPQVQAGPGQEPQEQALMFGVLFVVIGKLL